MAYNKAKAEREWLRWKESEELQLRQLGVDEDTMQRLHTYGKGHDGNARAVYIIQQNTGILRTGKTCRCRLSHSRCRGHR